MNAVLKESPLTLEMIEPIEHPAPAVQRASNIVSAPVAGPMGNALAFIQAGGTMDQLRDMLALQKDWEAGEALKAYNVAFSDFKAEAVRVLKSKGVTDGPLKGKAYAELHGVVDAVTPALSKHGLSASWKLTRDEKDWIEVTCTLKHVLGHSESVSMGGPPDAGGAKNAIQARASTVTYLERYTLKAVCGVAEGGQDDDGAGGPGKDTLLATWTKKVNEAPTEDALRTVMKDGVKVFQAARDKDGYASFAAAVQTRGAALKGPLKTAADPLLREMAKDFPTRDEFAEGAQS